MIGRSIRSVFHVIALAAVYAVVGRLGLMMDAVSGFATLVWPPTGIALAAVLLLGRRVWPGVAIGALAVNWWAGAPLLVACGIAAGNTAEALVGAWLLEGVADFRPTLDRLRDAIALVVLAALMSTALSASVGVASLTAAGIVASGRAWATWRAWWIGDAIGDLLVAPLLLTSLRRPLVAGERPRTTAPRALEAAALALLMAASGAAVFARRPATMGAAVLEPYLVFPVVIWAAARFSVRGASLTTFGLATIAIAGTALGRGPFGGGQLADRLLPLQSFMGVLAATMLILAASVEERRQAFALRDSLVSLASHELRTPLSSLQLRIQMCARNLAGSALEDGRLARDISAVDKSAQKLVDLVDDLLDVSRIMAGRLQLDLEDVDLDDLVREVVDRTPEPERRLVRIAPRAGGAIVGRWDRMRVEQIATNLVSNALKYGDGKQIEIEVAEVGGRARLVVRDHGVGIAREDLARVFERFERSASRGVGGFGLGLWIVRQVTDALAGTIAVDSARGRGSTFTVELPLVGRR